MRELHKLLQRQIKKHYPGKSLPENCTALINAINETYWEADEERKLIDRSLEISSQELLEKNSEIQAIFKAFPDVIFRLKTDGRILGYKAATNTDFHSLDRHLINQFIQDLVDPVTAKKFKESINKVIKTRSLTSIEYSEKINEENFYYEARFQPLLEDQVIVIIRSITDRVRAMEALKESEQRYALAAEGANDGLWDWNLEKNIIYFSPRWKSMLGYSDEEIGDDPKEWFSRVHPDDLHLVQGAIDSHKNTESPHLEVEYRIRNKNGTYLWVLTRGTAVFDKDNKVYRMAGSQTDITSRKEAEEQLRHDALHDKLTTLPNRALFFDRLNLLIGRAKRNKDYIFAVLFIDIDRFKTVNDTLGHECGDKVLIQIGERLSSCLRSIDTVARLGGDEFTILLDDIKNPKDAICVAERLHSKISSPIKIRDREIFVTASIGITMTEPGKTLKPESLLKEADTAMYRSKMQDNATHQVFDKNMQKHAMARLNLEYDLRRAIDHQEFVVHYQPIVSLADGSVIRLEALLRWQHPSRGLLQPEAFLPIAEETGMILPIGDWMLRSVCSQAKSWEKDGLTGFELAVNFSTRQFEDKNLPSLIKNIIKETGIRAFALEIEITESVAIKNADHSVKVLNDLKKLGVNISIDGFGAGYSSFQCLKLFPLDSLKIDRTFIQDISKDKDSAVIFSAFIRLAHAFDLKVIAEGVETNKQLEIIREQDCDAVQGNLLSPPLSTDGISSLLKSQARLI